MPYLLELLLAALFLWGAYAVRNAGWYLVFGIPALALALLPMADFFRWLPGTLTLDLGEVAESRRFLRTGGDFDPTWLLVMGRWTIPAGVVLGVSCWAWRSAQKTLRWKAVVPGMALAAGVLVVVYFVETEAVSVKMETASGQPARERPVKMIKWHEKDHSRLMRKVGNLRTGSNGVLSLRVRKGVLAGWEAASATGVRSAMFEMEVAPTVEHTGERFITCVIWFHDDWPLDAHSYHIERRIGAHETLRLRGVTQITNADAEKVLQERMEKLAEGRGTESDWQLLAMGLRENLDGLERLEQLPAILARYPQSRRDLSRALGVMAKNLADWATEAEDVLQNPASGLATDSLKNSQRRAEWMRVRPAGVWTELAKQVQEASCERLSRILRATQQTWAEVGVAAIRNCVVWRNGRDPNARTRIFPNGEWVGRVLEAAGKSRDHRSAFRQMLKGWEITVEEARRHFESTEPWTALIAYEAVSRKIPAAEIPAAVARVSEIGKGTKDPDLGDKVRKVLAELERRRVEKK